MRIHINLAVLLHDWLRRHAVSGPVLTMGLQGSSFNGDELDHVLDRGSTSRFSPSKPIDARELFEGFGLGQTVALDVNDHAAAEIIFDLNEPDPPPETRQRFGLIV